MERLLFECAVRAILIAVSTGLVLRAMRIKAAAARHRAWTVVVLLMLVLPVSAAFGPDIPLRVLQPEPVAANIPSAPVSALPSSSADSAYSGIQSPMETPAGRLPEVPAVPATARVVGWKALLVGIYFTGVFVMLLRLGLGTLQARRLIRSAVWQDGHLTSGSCNSPITVGWFHPVVILPIEWQRWPAAQLQAILTHEEEHARRYHPFVQWTALLNRAVFWFHPLAWWLERRIAALSEEGCDAAVLAAGHSPQDYSEYLLNLARSLMREGRRVQVVGMAMPGSCLKKRIRQILVGIPSQRMSRARVGCTIAFCTISSVAFGAVTLFPREVQALNSTAAAAVTNPAPLGSTPMIAEHETPSPSSSSSPSVVTVTGTSAPAVLELAAVSLEEEAASLTPARPPEVREEEFRVLPIPPQREPNAPATPPALLPSLLQGLTLGRAIVANTQMAGTWWTDPLLLLRLGLTEEQRASIEKVFEKHRQSLVASKERLRNEEVQHARLLEADPVDEQAVLAQIDRVVQARGQMEKASAAMNLEVRGYLTPAQWMQLRAQVPITSIDYVTRLQVTPAGIAVRP